MKGGNKGSDVTAFTGSQTCLTLNNQQSVQMHFTRGFIPFLWLLEVHTCMGKEVGLRGFYVISSYHYIIF